MLIYTEFEIIKLAKKMPVAAFDFDHTIIEVNSDTFINKIISFKPNHKFGKEIVADFSNYGAKNVDVFAPGVEIYATVPNNEYKYEQGTSMASPNAAGVAALIRSYYPQLTASQVKHILMDSGTPISETVVVDETKKEIPFSNACVSGKIVNAYNALQMAELLSKKIKVKKLKN